MCLINHPLTLLKNAEYYDDDDNDMMNYKLCSSVSFTSVIRVGMSFGEKSQFHVHSATMKYDIFYIIIV